MNRRCYSWNKTSLDLALQLRNTTANVVNVLPFKYCYFLYPTKYLKQVKPSFFRMFFFFFIRRPSAEKSRIAISFS